VRRWRALAPTTRAVCIFIVVNSVGVNLLFAALPWTPAHKTVFNYTFRTILANAGSDSWGQMATALAEFRAAPDGLLYHDVFFRRHIRFPYPPTSLLLTEAVDYLRVGSRFLNVVSFLAVIATVVLVCALLLGSFDRTRARLGRADHVALCVAAVLATLTFYPVVKGFALGQIQTWINLQLGTVVWLWWAGRERTAGVLIGIACALKPHYGLLWLWGASRRRWAFCGAFALTLAALATLSIWTFGVRNHVDYLWMLSYVSRHGESYFANNSVNGLLQRLLHNGDNLEWDESRYPPVNPFVVVGTLLASATLASICLFWRRRAFGANDIFDLMAAELTCVMASPVAWEHHYGILLPIYAAAGPMTLECRWRTIAWIVASYVLTSNYFGVTRLTANTVLNVAQSHLLFGAGIVLVLLYRMRGLGESE